MQAFGYLSGLIVTVVKHTPALGMCLFFGSNIAFLTCASSPNVHEYHHAYDSD